MARWNAACRSPRLCPACSALEDWDRFAPTLAEVARALEAGERDDAEPFEAAACAAPLPRAYQFVDGSAYVNHVELVRKARGAEMPESLWSDPLMYQGLSDGFLHSKPASAFSPVAVTPDELGAA